MRFLDLNADLGEGGAEDPALIGLVTSANIACGGHAGDEKTMRAAMECCLQAGVAIGAHPGYEDREHFGRRMLDLPAAEVKSLVTRQLTRFLEIAERAGARVQHVKPHGALYHQAASDFQVAEAVAGAAAEILPGCGVYSPDGSALAEAARRAGLRVWREGFIDRRYMENGGLVPRGEPGAVIAETSAAVAQALQIACKQRVQTTSGSWLALSADTLCVHGDSPHAVEILHAVKIALASAGCELRVCAG